MISKQAFISIITAIKDHQKRLEKISTFLEDNVVDGWAIIDSPITVALIDALQKDLNCENELGGEINWWLYDLKEEDDKIIEYADGRERNVTKVEDFYDYLIECYNTATTGLIQPMDVKLPLTESETEFKSIEEVLDIIKEKIIYE